jgi:hypothetical protein
MPDEPGVDSPGIAEIGAASVGTAFRDALRLLFILVRGSVPLPEDRTTDEHDRVFIGEKRAQAIDFSIRYPDYLADDLLDLHEETGDEAALAAARRIFEEDEPEVRIVRMIRWRRGAYEDLQDSLAILNYRGLVKPMRREIGPDAIQYEFLVGPKARRFLDDAVSDQPALAWYDRQVGLALRIATTRSGSALKDIHYEHPEYASTPYGTVIPPIRERVLARLGTIATGRQE